MLKNLYCNQKIIEQDDSKISKNENNLLPEVIRSEVNMLVLPFFALWDKGLKKKTKTEYKAIAKRGNRKLEISWTVLSNPEFGYPGPFDRKVYKAIEQIVNYPYPEGIGA